MGKGKGKGRGNIRLSEIIYKNGSTLAKSQYSIFMQGSVRRQDAFSEPLDHGAREGEILFSIKKEKISSALQLSLQRELGKQG